MIEFENVTRTYDEKVAVDGLDLTVGTGELFAFLGPNGAGKTTSIKMLVGLLRTTKGSIRVCGRDTRSDTRQTSQYVGYVPDQPYLYDKLSGREFLEFVAQMRGMGPNQLTQAIDEQSERFELSGFLSDLTETYSHGMKQRVVFASALLHDPPVLVVDEPMVGLDPKSARMVKDLLREKSSAGTTVFMSTHTLSVAEEIADRIGIIDRGRLSYLGTLDELREHSPEERLSLEQIFLKLTAGDNGQSPETTFPQPQPTE